MQENASVALCSQVSVTLCSSQNNRKFNPVTPSSFAPDELRGFNQVQGSEKLSEKSLKRNHFYTYTEYLLLHIKEVTTQTARLHGILSGNRGIAQSIIDSW